MKETKSSQLIATRLQRIAEQAKERPRMVFTTLAHLIDVGMLREAYKGTNKKGSPGVDGVTAEQYECRGTRKPRNRMRELRTSGSVGGLAGQPATRRIQERLWLRSL